MKEKSVKEIEKEARRQEELRQQTIRDFNVNNAGELWIDPAKSPTEEDIEQAKKDFEERTKALNEKDDYLIADKTEALRVAKFLRDFIKNSFWQKRMWVGVLNYVAEVEEFIEKCEKEPQDYVLDYPATQFLDIMLDNYAGFGYDAAEKMANMWDEFVAIADTIKGITEAYNAEVKECEKLQQRWAAMCQGYYMVIIPPEERAVTDTEAEAADNPGEGESDTDTKDA